MITIIHGDDIVASRKELTDIKEDFIDGEVFQFEGAYTSITDVVQVFESQSLFEKKKLIVLENFLATKDKALLASILNHLKKSTYDAIFWEPKEIKKEFLAFFPKSSNVYFFKQEQALFKFLDSIRPGNGRQILPLFHRVLKKESEELILYMLVRQFRLLLGISYKAGISEAKRLVPWQRGKLEGQAAHFGQERLVLLYRKLFQIEKGSKTGTAPMPIIASLDLFLADI